MSAPAPAVRAAIRQEPYLGFSALGDVYLAGKGEQPTAAIAPQKLSEAGEAWTVVKDTTSIAALELFIERYKDTYYAGLARLRIEELKTKVALAVSTAPPPAAKEAKPAAVITPARCDGIEITVGQHERRCFKPGAGKTDHFKDCATCPEMVVIPAGSFTMGSPATEPERYNDEAQVRVSIPAPFAVGRYTVTFD